MNKHDRAHLMAAEYIAKGIEVICYEGDNGELIFELIDPETGDALAGDTQDDGVWRIEEAEALLKVLATQSADYCAYELLDELADERVIRWQSPLAAQLLDDDEICSVNDASDTTGMDLVDDDAEFFAGVARDDRVLH
ncbi:MAG: hypothetical protein ABMA14_16345 [Hyphomonadaceae bacterium]